MLLPKGREVIPPSLIVPLQSRSQSNHGMVSSPVIKAPALILAACLLLLSSAHAENCDAAQSDFCDGIAYCDKTADFLNTTGFTCSCPDGLYGSGYTQAFIDANPGEGIADPGCDSEGAAVRFSFLLGDTWNAKLTSGYGELGMLFSTLSDRNEVRDWIVGEIFGGADFPYLNISGFVYRITTDGDCGDNAGTQWFTASLIFKNLLAAETYLAANLHAEMKQFEVFPQNASAVFSSGADPFGFELDLRYSPNVGNGVSQVGSLASAPRAYEWVAGTTSDPITIMPTGMEVISVDFKFDCLTAGCWVVDVTYTRGEENANVFYIPRSNNDDTLSFDYVYGPGAADLDTFETYSGTTWNLDKTYQPSNFPCGNDAYNYNPAASDPIQRTVTACCIPEFIDNYRPLNGFASADFGGMNYTALKSTCDANFDDAPEMKLDELFCNALTGHFHDDDSFSGHWRDTAPAPAHNWTAVNMETSHVDYMGAIDPYLGIYKARFYLDEIELRRFAGKLQGTVSVEHSVDFFVGLAEFKPAAGNQYIDMATKQTDIHVEKTDYFTVATHGVNAYTFLRYINLRLIHVYDEDDSKTDDERTANFYRTTPTYLTQYVQVTFTLGADYERKPGYDIIPSDSVRIGRGAFSSSAQFSHACAADWTTAGDGNDGPAELGMNASDKTAFKTALEQSCGPVSQMCLSPAAIPDSFVAFNVPAFDKVSPMGYFGAATPDISNNIFIDLVVQVQNTAVMAGTGTTANITKTTLKAQIPVVTGGINIFCDTVGAKTDLKDVADVTVVIGSANSSTEFSRLRVLENIASSSMTPNINAASSRADSDSIEAGLMTLIVLGKDDYFRDPFNNDGSAAANFGLELEDVITIHVMEDAEGKDPFDSALVGGKILALVNAEGEELYDSSNQLMVGGYALNGAFGFVINRAEGVAELMPSNALTAQAPAGPGCSFAATRSTTTGTQSFPSACIIRRDIRGRNCMTIGNGALSVTASELPSCVDEECSETTPVTSNRDSNQCPGTNSIAPSLAPDAYMQTILGGSVYAAELGTSFAKVIAKQYKLNNRSRRAWFVNPGYEWTATQTGGQSKFQISQTLFMFALFGLNENRLDEARANNVLRRRFLLQTQGDGSSTLGTTAISTSATPIKTLASANGVHENDVAWFKAEVALTKEEACMSDSDLQDALREAMVDGVDFAGVATGVATVQIQGVTRAMNGVVCTRRSLMSRKLLADYSEASAKLNVFVVFKMESDAPTRFINVGKLEDALADRLTGDALKPNNGAAEDIDCRVNCGETDSGGDKETPKPGNTWTNDADSESGVSPLSASFSALLACVVAAFAFARKY